MINVCVCIYIFIRKYIYTHDFVVHVCFACTKIYVQDVLHIDIHIYIYIFIYIYVYSIHVNQIKDNHIPSYHIYYMTFFLAFFRAPKSPPFFGHFRKKGNQQPTNDMFAYMDVSENSGVSPQIIHFNRVFHYKPSIFRYPYVWKHPYMKLKTLNHPSKKYALVKLNHETKSFGMKINNS